MKKLFEIEHYVRTNTRIFVHCDFPNHKECIEIPISRGAFQDWLDKSDRLEWIRDEANHLGEHLQEAGRYTTAEYWENSQVWEIKRDLYDYIVLKMNEDKDVFNIKSALDDILYDYTDN